MKIQKSVKLVTVLTIIFAIITFISLFFNSLLKLYLSYKVSKITSQVGASEIIGGADGPTAIYLASGSSSYVFAVIFGFLTVLGIIYLIIVKNKRNYN